MNPYHAYRLELGKGQMGECIFKMLNFLMSTFLRASWHITIINQQVWGKRKIENKEFEEQIFHINDNVLKK